MPCNNEGILPTWDMRTRNMIARNEITYLLIDGNLDLKSTEVKIIAITSGFRWFLSLNELRLLLKVYEDNIWQHINHVMVHFEMATISWNIFHISNMLAKHLIRMSNEKALKSCSEKSFPFILAVDFKEKMWLRAKTSWQQKRFHTPNFGVFRQMTQHT